MVEIIQKKDFVEINYTGFENSRVFDSNIAEDLKKISPDAKPSKTIVVVGEGMIVPGFDGALEGKEVGKDYEVQIEPKEAFGTRDRNLVKTIPLKVFTQQKVIPHPGQTLLLDHTPAKIIAVSGARVITDFNHPLSGKEVTYKFKILRKIVDEKEKAQAFFEFFFRMVPEFEVGEKIVITSPKELESIVKVFSPKFKELVGKDLIFSFSKAEKNSGEKTSQQSL